MIHGEICQISDLHFIWKIHFSDFSDVTNFISSPTFYFRGHSWFVTTMVVSYGAIKFRITRLKSRNRNPCAETYRMSIEDIEGKYYWSSPSVTDEFSYAHDFGTFQSCRELDFKKIENIITSGGDLSLHLTFDPPATPFPNPREEVLPTEANLSSSTTDVGKQTCSEPETKPICSCRLDGVDELLQDLKDLLLSGQTSDVTLNVKGTEIKAHRTILIARSPVFAKMFDHDMLEETTGTVQIIDCEPEDFRAFLFYLYTGKVENPTVESVVELYCLADKYNVAGLGPYCVKFLLSNLSVESFCDIITLGLRHCETLLLNSANTFFAQNMKQIVCSEKWKIFNKENPDEANEILIKGFSTAKILPDSS